MSFVLETTPNVSILDICLIHRTYNPVEDHFVIFIHHWIPPCNSCSKFASIFWYNLIPLHKRHSAYLRELYLTLLSENTAGKHAYPNSSTFSTTSATCILKHPERTMQCRETFAQFHEASIFSNKNKPCLASFL